MATGKAHDGTGGAGYDALTPREREVLRHIAEGDANNPIASSLGVSVATVERHVTNLYRKLGAQGRADATRAAMAMGLVSTRASG